LTNSEQYIPTAPGHISAAMRDIEMFLHRAGNFNATIKAAHAHYQFETIHPSITGNGRIGRMLPYLIFYDRKILTRPILCLSQYLHQNKLEYIGRMERLWQVFEYEQWIKFYKKSVIYAAADSIERIKKWLDIREANFKKIKDRGKPIKVIDKTMEIIELNPIIDVNTLAEQAGVSYNTAAATLKLLLDLEIVKQRNRLKRNHDYIYYEFANCFIGDIAPY